MFIYPYLYIIVLFFELTVLIKEFNTSCLGDNDKPTWKRYFHFKDEEIPIKIDVSSRRSHQIWSRILQILLQERLGYNAVNLTNYNETTITNDINRLNCINNTCENGNPEAHINVEMFIRPEFRLTENQARETINCGPLGPYVRKGVFVHTMEANRRFQDKQQIIDYWRILGNQNYYCQSKTSDSCSQLTAKMNDLPNKSPTTSTVQSQKGAFNSDTQMPSDELNPNNIILNWYPNVDTIQGNFTRVLFPDCWRSDIDASCDFEVHQVKKFVWSHLKVHADKAFHLINEMELTNDEYAILLNSVDVTAVNEIDENYRVACEWINNNKGKWSQWTPEWDSKEELYLPIFISNYEIWRAEEIVNASTFAVEDLNERKFKKTRYTIIPKIYELICDTDIILSTYMSLIDQLGPKIIGFVVCLCPRTFDALIKISELQNRIMISSSVESTQGMNLAEYKYFFSTQPNLKQYNLILIKMFHLLRWKRVIILKNDENLLDEKILLSYNIKVIDSKMTREDQLTYEDIYTFLHVAKTKHKASIFIVHFQVSGTQLVMCAAGNLQMTLAKGYVFILNPLIDPLWWQKKPWKKCPSQTIISKEFFIIKHDTTAEHSDDYVRASTSKVNNLGHVTRDAILYLGNSLHQLLQNNTSAYLSMQSKTISEKYVDILLNQYKTLIGVKSNYKRTIFNKNHERNGIWTVQRVADSMSFLVSIPLFTWPLNGTFEGGLPMLETFKTHTSQMIIPNDTNSESDCAVEILRSFFNWSCTATLIFINISSIVVGITIFIGCLTYYYRKQAVIMEDRFKKPFEDLCTELADIDIRSSDVVISLQVGKGAFGIVYGGEAKRNTRWESVAIKLIKKEADYQGKIDFLTEAKLMRNLEHPNIVKLIGICLNPLKPAIYLVMELVVNGDLEDYLLTNRITANKDPNNKMVCPLLLTRFVKNIAAGTEYLHRHSLLHRDLACRNCFLSEDYVIKIGDFGLTRNINDSQMNQYYRTTRHFVLPVRWMPPEAVQFGYFSIQSDIWSLGVVIFEVATFCSRPYFNVTDEEVPELVKRNTMPLVNYLPENAKNSDVYKLIDRCCQYKREERPQSMIEIVNYLESNNECIKPYITINPPQAVSISVWNLMNPCDIHQRANSTVAGGLNRFKSTSRSRNSVVNWAVFNDSVNIGNQYLQTDSDASGVPFPCNKDQVPFIPNKNEFITLNSSTNRIGSKKQNKANKKSSSNLNSSKSRSSDFMTVRIDDDQEPSYVSCPDQGNLQCLGDFDAQDFPYNDSCKPFIRSASGDEKSITSGKRTKSYRNGKVMYTGSSRNQKSKSNKYGSSNKSKSRLNASQVHSNRRISDANGVMYDYIQPLLYDRPNKVCIQPLKAKNFKNCADDDAIDC